MQVRSTTPQAASSMALIEDFSSSFVDVEMLREKILADKGIDFSQYKDGYLQRRLARRLRGRKIRDASRYLRLLDEDPEEYRLLLDILTVNHTMFFRNAQVFEVIRREVLPQILANKRKWNFRLIRVWCAGCASGEEAFSVAMMVSDVLKDEKDITVSVVGTDIDEASLRKANEGVYGFGATEDMPVAIRDRFLVRQGENFKISSDLYDRVRFRFHDLIRDEPLKGMDIVFCRNVLIYFKKELQEEILKKLYTALGKGGFLVLGKVEGLLGSSRKLFDSVDSREHIFSRN